jgi:hypothetical protein
VRQGHYFKDESFDGHGGGASFSLPDRRRSPVHRNGLSTTARRFSNT